MRWPDWRGSRKLPLLQGILAIRDRFRKLSPAAIEGPIDPTAAHRPVLPVLWKPSTAVLWSFVRPGLDRPRSERRGMAGMLGTPLHGTLSPRPHPMPTILTAVSLPNDSIRGAITSYATKSGVAPPDFAQEAELQVEGTGWLTRYRSPYPPPRRINHSFKLAFAFETGECLLLAVESALPGGSASR
jgi:hypothetical protein